MADLCDMAQDADQVFTDAALAGIKRYGGIAPFECAECGEEIEAKRRELLMSSATHCAACAKHLEQRRKITYGVRS